MAKNLLLLLLLGTTLTLSNCNEEEEEDVTVEITGEYVGAYGSNPSGEINPYEITIERIDNKRISVKPKSGNEFDAVEFELEKINSSTINSPTNDNQQLEQSVTFAIGVPVQVTLSIDPMGDAHTFVGEKQ